MAKKTQDALAAEGFRISDREGRVQDFLLLALRAGLDAFFETHRGAGALIQDLNEDIDNEAVPADEDDRAELRARHLKAHNSEYFESYAKTVVFLQQFAELRIKGCLAQRHPLLVADPRKSVVLLDRLLQGGTALTPEEEFKLQFVEASEAMKRLEGLRAELTDAVSQTLLKHKSTIDTLNGLRNRMLHRGVWVLHYTALDRLVCEHFFNLLRDLYGADPAMLALSTFWKYKPLHAGFDPIELLNDHYRTASRSLYKTVILKEFARAGYRNPVLRLANGVVLDTTEVRLAKRAAEEHGDPQACPVCGQLTLVVEDDLVDPSDDSHNLTYPYLASCYCCSLMLRHEWGNPSKYGIPNVPDYFGVTIPPS